VIAHLDGVVREREGEVVVLDVGGVGYELLATTTASARCEPGTAVSLPTHLQVREDAMTLYGFADASERALFRLLLGVTGVGPRLALALVSAHEPARLQAAIAQQDVPLLTSVSGVGRKTAERICLDLQDRVDGVGVAAAATAGGRAAPADPHREARDALVGLGYALVDAEAALEGADGDAEQRLRIALAALAGGR